MDLGYKTQPPAVVQHLSDMIITENIILQRKNFVPCSTHNKMLPSWSTAEMSYDIIMTEIKDSQGLFVLYECISPVNPGGNLLWSSAGIKFPLRVIGDSLTVTVGFTVT